MAVCEIYCLTKKNLLLFYGNMLFLIMRELTIPSDENHDADREVKSGNKCK